MRRELKTMIIKHFIFLLVFSFSSFFTSSVVAKLRCHKSRRSWRNPKVEIAFFRRRDKIGDISRRFPTFRIWGRVRRNRSPVRTGSSWIWRTVARWHFAIRLKTLFFFCFYNLYTLKLIISIILFAEDCIDIPILYLILIRLLFIISLEI